MHADEPAEAPDASRHPDTQEPGEEPPDQEPRAGGEGATAAEVRSAVARQEPILLQWWEPTWLASVYNLKRIVLDDASFDAFSAAIANPPRPNAKLRALFQKR